LIPIAYMIIEGRFRRRTWAENGFNLKAFPRDLVKNLGWVLLVGVVLQAASVYGAYLFLPEYSAHVMARLPLDAHSLSAAVVISLLIATLGEEVIYRAFFQNRLGAFLPIPAAIGLSSLVFALMHYTPGPFLVVLVDVALVLVDSVIYGLIFARTKNVFCSWTAHFLADVVGLLFLMSLVK
ncbi:MAG TPA: CPBP family intramembrane glutamic endopeptidase, partial [Anaerolineaceae bacterium]|nr:CPBP family intramembrane glutamic endopeptidase [Anaerolineaceae bacterium]